MLPERIAELPERGPVPWVRRHLSSPNDENLVRQEWTSKTTVTAWDKWAKEQAMHCQPLTDVLLSGARLLPDLSVLDRACGVGQPSLSVAAEVGAGGQSEPPICPKASVGR